MSGVSDNKTQVEGETAEDRSNHRQDENDPGQGTVEESAEFIQDQIIIAPETMKKVLEHLDLKDLKTVRLVCKSWLLEAQSHMQDKGIVGLGEMNSCTIRIEEFIGVQESKIPALPQPFLSLDVDLESCMDVLPAKQILSRLSSLCPPLLITRFSPVNIPLTLALPLIMQCSSSLEYLRITATFWQQELQEKNCDSPERDPDFKFPKLRQLMVDTTERVSTLNWEDFLDTLAWITRASPNFDTFKMVGRGDKSLENKLLRQVEIASVTTLSLVGSVIKSSTFEHFASLPFAKLQNLCMTNLTGPGYQALLALVGKAAKNLRKLHLWDLKNPLLHPVPFPVCPNVQELHIELFPDWNHFVSRCFPSLQDLAPQLTGFDNDQEHFRGIPPFPGVKTLRLLNCGYGSDGPTEIFKAFPGLERLHIHASFLLEYCGMKASGGPGFEDFLPNLKYVELEGNKRSWKDITEELDFSLLAELKGLETLTVSKLSEVIKVPVKDMPSLKVLRFAWVQGTCTQATLDQLLESTKGVEKAVVTNCCSILRESSAADKMIRKKMFSFDRPNTNVVYCKEKKLLMQFFDSAPNAVCGCKERKEQLKPFWVM